eukprot:jgi/Picre1/31038/NNA_006395.t1
MSSLRQTIEQHVTVSTKDALEQRQKLVERGEPLTWNEMTQEEQRACLGDGSASPKPLDPAFTVGQNIIPEKDDQNMINLARERALLQKSKNLVDAANQASKEYTARSFADDLYRKMMSNPEDAGALLGMSSSLTQRLTEQGAQIRTHYKTNSSALLQPVPWETIRKTQLLGARWTSSHRCTGGMRNTNHESPSTLIVSTQHLSGTSTIKHTMIEKIHRPKSSKDTNSTYFILTLSTQPKRQPTPLKRTLTALMVEHVSYDSQEGLHMKMLLSE